jgi:hypothetical protein
VRAGPEATANAVHDRLIQYLETPIVLLAGDVAEIITNDASTGGTVEFIAQFVIMEFDQ